MSDALDFKPVRHCPVCNDYHEVKFQYQGIDIVCCPKMEEDKMMLMTEEYANDKLNRLAHIQRFMV